MLAEADRAGIANGDWETLFDMNFGGASMCCRDSGGEAVQFLCDTGALARRQRADRPQHMRGFGNDIVSGAGGNFGNRNDCGVEHRNLAGNHRLDG